MTLRLKMRVLAVSAFSVCAATAAMADRALTTAEQEKLQAALGEQGCKGGHQKVDDGLFEVDDATCADGRIYDLKFGPDFKLLDKDLER